MARGDEEFAEFVRASSARLTHAAYLLTGDRHQAEDAAQTAFTRTYAAWARVRHKDAYGYARTVLVNHVIDGWRRPIREYATDRREEQERTELAEGEQSRPDRRVGELVAEGDEDDVLHPRADVGCQRPRPEDAKVAVAQRGPRGAGLERDVGVDDGVGALLRSAAHG